MKIRHSYRAAATLGVALAGAPLLAVAQDNDSNNAEDLGEITVTSPRVETPLSQVPYAIDLVGKDDIQRGTQQLGLDEALTKVPGVFLLNRYNFAQDIRVAIRGFGARTEFGIRGVKIFIDDIPRTLADGQGGLGNIDLASAERVEVIRGPASSLYGAASGGVINVISEEGPEVPFVEGRYSGGSYGFHKYNLKAGGQKDDLNYMFNIGRLHLDGYRENSETEKTQFNGKLRYDIDATSDFTTVINVIDSPRAKDAGGLNEQQVREDRRQAAPNNLLFNTGAVFDQQQVGFVYRKEINQKHEVRLRNYYVWRDFFQSLPIGNDPSVFNIDRGQVGFDRFFFGGGAQYTYSGDINRLTVGFDIDQQNDDRKNWINLAGGERGDLVLDQREEVSSIGFYIQNEQYLTDQLTLTTGLRYDKVEFKVNDKFLSNGDDSGVIEFSEMSPQIGLLWSPRREVNLYGNISTAFETPTTTEFGTPSGAGFNQALQPQTATQYEIGIKGSVPRWYGLTYDAAVFQIDGEDELVPVNTDINFFTNAGKTDRKGFELALSANPLPGLTTSLAYTYSRFKYRQFRDEAGNSFAGNDLPGVPRHYGQIEIAYEHPSGFYAVWDTQLVGRLFAEDANEVRVPGYGVSNIRAGYTRLVGDSEIEPFVGVNNIFDKEYFSNVRLNAFGGRYFEPAPEINAYAGISIRHNFL